MATAELQCMDQVNAELVVTIEGYQTAGTGCTSDSVVGHIP